MLIIAVILKKFINEGATSVPENIFIATIKEIRKELNIEDSEDIITKKTESDILNTWCRSFGIIAKIKKNDEYEVELNSHGVILKELVMLLDNPTALSLSGSLVENILHKTKQIEISLTQKPEEQIRFFNNQIKKYKDKIEKIKVGGKALIVSDQEVKKSISDLMRDYSEIYRLLSQAGDEFYNLAISTREKYEEKIELGKLDSIDELKNALLRHDNFLQGETGEAYQNFNSTLNRGSAMNNFIGSIRKIITNKRTIEAINNQNILKEVKSIPLNLSEQNMKIYERKSELNNSLGRFFGTIISKDYIRKNKLISDIEKLLIKIPSPPLFETFKKRQISNFFNKRPYIPNGLLNIPEIKINEVQKEKMIVDNINYKLVNKVVGTVSDTTTMSELLEKFVDFRASEFIELQNRFNYTGEVDGESIAKMDNVKWKFQNYRMKKRIKI